MDLVLTNCPPESALSIATQIIENRLAACANILPNVQSVYVWDGEVQQEVESTLLLKVAQHGTERLVDAIRSLHPYEVPEILVIPVDDARSFEKYVSWVRDHTSHSDPA